ncbi:MAG: glycine--tRNA ligase subunit beta [Vicinamibacteria bacterium]
MAEFLFEIGFEEMPAPWLSNLATQLEDGFCDLSEREHLGLSKAETYWTSRRLVLVATLKSRQPDRTVVEWGPAAKIAKDAAGNWSKASEGFARKQGVGLDALNLSPKVEGSNDLYVSATKEIAGRPTADVLAGLLPSILRGFNFPKRMNWDAWLDDGRGAFEFGRPIQWIVALLDGAVVPVTIFDAVAGVKGSARVVSGARSMGNRFYPREVKDRGFEVKSFAELEAGLKARFVVLDPAKRTERIRGQVEAAGGSVSGDGAHLIAEWCDLVEYPTIAVGSIPKEFADLPIEVLETALSHHQKAITLPAGPDGAPRFAAISGCDEAGVVNARRGQERVVVARLKDARFFYDEDRKRTLESRVDDLAMIAFQKGLGSYKDKAVRISALAEWLGKQAGADDFVVADARRAALLAKADLSSLMVREFPELQGIMGGLYAQGSEESAVADAIRWHYHPIAIERGALPTGKVGIGSSFALIALADRLDTLVGYFALGLVPSGSSDPYGLRRAGQGAMRILLDFWGPCPPGMRPLDMVRAIEFSYATFNGALSKSREETAGALLPFLTERLRNLLTARPMTFETSNENAIPRLRVLPADVDAVLEARIDALSDVGGAQERLHNLVQMRAEEPEVFASLAQLFKRAKNIVASSAESSTLGLPDASAFTCEEEKALHTSILKVEQVPPSYIGARLVQIAWTEPYVAAFFDALKVLDDDPTVRKNRLALLARLLDLVYEIADLSKLASPSGDKAVSS